MNTEFTAALSALAMAAHKLNDAELLLAIREAALSDPTVTQFIVRMSADLPVTVRAGRDFTPTV